MIISDQQANGLRVSPFRIVRIVDREGEIQSIRYFYLKFSFFFKFYITCLNSKVA